MILCGGMATRLYPITKKIPKSMILVNRKPFLEYQIELLKRNGIYDIVLCVGNRSTQIKKYFGNGNKFGVTLSYSADGKKLLGTAGAIKNAEELLENVFMVMYGDSYLPFDFQKAIKFFNKYNKKGLMTVYKNSGKYDKSNVVVSGDYVKIYSKTEKKKNMSYIDYGASILRKDCLKLIPKEKIFDMSDVFQKLITQKELLAFDSKKRFYEIGSFAGLEEFKKYSKKL